MELLLFERNSAFFHKLWSRYFLLGLYQFSPDLLKAHNRQTETFGYSPTQDAFYALDKAMPNNSKPGQLWAMIMQTPEFKEAVRLFEDGSQHTKANLVYWLSLVFQHYIVPKQPEPQGGKGKDNPKKGKPPENKPQDGKSNQDQQQPGKPEKFDESKGDTQQDILMAGQAPGEDEPTDLEPDPNADVNSQFEIKLPKEDIDMSGLEEVKAKNESDAVMSSFMSNDPGTPTEKRRQIEKFDKLRSVKNLAKFLGWAERIVGASVRQTKGAVGYHTGMITGGWDANVDTLEQYAIITRDPQALSRFADDNLDKFAVESDLPVGNGDVLVLRDESNSMRHRPMTIDWYADDFDKMPPALIQAYQQFMNFPDKDTLAVNLEVALAYEFFKTGRKLTSVAWDDRRTRIYTYGQPGVMKHLSEFLNGGTSINHVLTKVFDRLDQSHNKARADILIISDDQITDNPKHDPTLWRRIQQYRKDGGRIWAVLITKDKQSNPNLGTWVDGFFAMPTIKAGEAGLTSLVKAMSMNRAENARRQVT